MSDPRLKQIKIKTGVLKRVGKEKLSYRKEADQQKVKIEKMKEEGREEVRNYVHLSFLYSYLLSSSDRDQEDGRGGAGDLDDDPRLSQEVGGCPR